MLNKITVGILMAVLCFAPYGYLKYSQPKVQPTAQTISKQVSVTQIAKKHKVIKKHVVTRPDSCKKVKAAGVQYGTDAVKNYLNANGMSDLTRCL